MKHWILPAATAVVLLFTSLVFKNLARQGILYHDIGMNLLEARFIADSVQIAGQTLHQGSQTPALWEKLKQETTGVPLHSGKPMDATVLWLASLVRGFHDTLSAEVSAVCGILGLILVFLITLELTGALAAFYALACLASSTFYLMYSRSAFADMPTLLFFLLGLWIYIRWGLQAAAKKSLFFAGLCFAFMFCSTQWRVLYIPGLIGLLELFSPPWTPPFLISRIKRGLLLLAGFLIPLLGFELPYFLLRMRLGILPFRDYWEQLHERLLTSGGLTWFSSPLEMSQIYWRVEQGVFPAVVLLAWIWGLSTWLKQPSRKTAVPWLFSALPFIYFSIMKYGGAALPRTTSLTIPTAAICAGIFFANIQKYLETKGYLPLKFHPLASCAAAIVLLTLSIPRNLSFGITRSGYAEASAYLRAHEDTRPLVLGMEPVWRFYLGRLGYPPYDRPANLRALVDFASRKNLRRLILDHTVIYSKYGMEYTRALFGKVSPEAVFDNPRGCNLLYLLDDFGLDKSLEIAQDPTACKIFIFRLADIEKALADGHLSESKGFA